jgi:hypothetical protein
VRIELDAHDRPRSAQVVDVLVDTPFGDIVVPLMVSKGIVVALTRFSPA